MSVRPIHELLRFYYQRQVEKFAVALKQPQTVQEKVLHEIFQELPGHNQPRSYEEFAQTYPLTTYQDWEAKINEQRQTHRELVARKVSRFEPTSGSIHQRKWIPYSEKFLQEINAAAAVWMGDLYQQYPELKRGSHFWSLSWLPQELRAEITADDSELFPWWQRFLLQKTMTLPKEVAKISSMEAFSFALICYLAADEDLTLISVWSPTLLLKLLADLKQQWPAIAQTLNKGEWAAFSQELQSVPAPKRKVDSPSPNSLWPKLSLISCWTSSSSREFAEQLQKEFPGIPLQGKGLWATEGVVTIPFQKKYPLAIQSHFYEFRDLATGVIFTSWQLKEGMVVEPILTTGSGLIRYCLGDQIQVSGFLEKTPCFEFLVRSVTSDLVGEKLSQEFALNVLRNLRAQSPDTILTLIANKKPQPHYSLAVLAAVNPSLIDKAEAQLCALHHYRLARQLGQLGSLKGLSLSSLEDLNNYVKLPVLAGQFKVDPITQGKD